LKHRKRDALFYAIGPAGIVKVLYMTTTLLYTYATILLPMILRKYDGSHYKWIVLAGHLSLETYLLIQIFFNYYCCITTKHSGPHQEQIIQEMAKLTEFQYPHTPVSLATHQKHVEDRLASIEMDDSKGKKKTPSWLLLDPFEWGYCANTQQPRPPRSHYSFVLRMLVLNFDHYCPWIWNAGTSRAIEILSIAIGLTKVIVSGVFQLSVFHHVPVVRLCHDGL
jgi:DHHC palmitoyltransferase